MQHVVRIYQLTTRSSYRLYKFFHLCIHRPCLSLISTVRERESWRCSKNYSEPLGNQTKRQTALTFSLFSETMKKKKERFKGKVCVANKGWNDYIRIGY
jgi:hypothetical protein